MTNPDQSVIYRLTGHGESDLPSTFADSLEQENIAVEDFSLLNSGAVPEDAAGVLVYSPASDLSEEEAQMLAEYVEQGGKRPGPCRTRALPTSTAFWSAMA